MSLTGFGEMDDMFGRMDRMMNSMMQSMIGNMGMMDPMQMMNPMNQMNQMALRSAFAPSTTSSSSHHRHHSASSAMQSYPFAGNHITPYGTAYPGISSYSSSVVTMTSDGLGRTRQVYEASSSTRLAPGGVRETQSTVRDSRTGRHEMSIGHHLHDKSHVVKKSKNAYTGQEEHEEDFVNVEEDEEPTFEQNWRRAAAAGYHHRSTYNRPSYSRPSPALTIPDYPPSQPPRRQFLALPAPPAAPSATASRPPSRPSSTSSSSRAVVPVTAHQPSRPSYTSSTSSVAPVSSNSSRYNTLPEPIRSRSSSITSSERLSNHLFAHNHHVNGFNPLAAQSAASSSSVARPASPLDQMRRERRDKGKQRRERPY